METVDLGAIDIPRLFANYVSNEFNESGYLSTTPPGDEIRRYPYIA